MARRSNEQKAEVKRRKREENRKFVAKLLKVTNFFTAAITDDNITKEQYEAGATWASSSHANSELTGDHERAAAFTVHEPGRPVSITTAKM